jgi:hypothetical protein
MGQLQPCTIQIFQLGLHFYVYKEMKFKLSVLFCKTRNEIGISPDPCVDIIPFMIKIARENTRVIRLVYLYYSSETDVSLSYCPT